MRLEFGVAQEPKAGKWALARLSVVSEVDQSGRVAVVTGQHRNRIRDGQGTGCVVTTRRHCVQERGGLCEYLPPVKCSMSF